MDEKLKNEINMAENFLTNSGLYWSQYYGNKDVSYNIDARGYNVFQSDEDFWENDQIRTIAWNEIMSKNAIRDIYFCKNGNVWINKISSKVKGIDYSFVYNILRNNFIFVALNRNLGKKYFIDDTFFKEEYTGLGSYSVKNERNGRIVTYETIIKNNASIIVQINYNKNGEIDRCCVDFKTLELNGEIDGVHTLRISRDGNATLNYIYNYGLSNLDLTGYLDSSLVFDGITLMSIIDMIKTVNATVINNKAFIELWGYIKELINKEHDVILFLKQINGEIFLPHLRDIVEEFVSTYDDKRDKNKDTVRKRVQN